MLGILLVVPVVLPMIAAEWSAGVAPYLLSNAGVELFFQSGFSVIEEGWQNLLITLAWIAASLGLAGMLLMKRDV